MDLTVLRRLTTCVMRMFASNFLKKPLAQISDVDINIFLSSFNRFGTRADVARQIIFILFGRVHKDHDVLLNIVVGWLTLTKINNFQDVCQKYELQKYNVLIRNWRIASYHPTFTPDLTVIDEINNIIYYSLYKWANSKRGLDEESNKILQIWPNRRVKRSKISVEESEPIDIVPNTRPLKQVPQQPSTTPMQIPEACQSVKKETLRIIDPSLGGEVENISNRGRKRSRTLSQPQSNQWAGGVCSKTIQFNSHEINKTVRMIVDEISPDNFSLLTERFKTLPIDNIKYITMTVNLIFEKAIENQGFAPLCSSLCSAMQSKLVISNKRNEATFNKLLINNCESVFELDKAKEMDFAMKLTLCEDLIKKKKLQLEYEKYKKTSHECSIRNCRFMGELFKQKILTPNIMMGTIEKLMTKRVKEPIECVCVLLKTVGEELELTCNLNDTFDQLNALTSKSIKPKIPLRIIFLIKDIINIRKNKWNVDRIDHYMILINKIKDNVASEQQQDHHLHDDSKISPIQTVEQPMQKPVLLNSIVGHTINMKCKKILLEYELLQNLDDIIYSLSEDESSVIHTRYEEFVKSMSLISLDSPITQTTIAGKILAELLSKKILSMAAITRGIDDVLKYWNDFLMEYPQFFSYIAAIIAPLLLSPNASFDFNNFKDSCKSIRPDNSSQLFTEILYKINSAKETQDIKGEPCGILWIYNKWNMLENLPVDVFMPINQINKYFKKDQIGVFLLSIAIYDKIKLTDNIKIWISTNINAEIIRSPLFVRALTIAIVILCKKLNYSYEDFFGPSHLKLLTHYITFTPLPKNEFQAREVQCMYGIQIMSAILNHPGGMVLKLFNNLYQHGVISKESFELFLEYYEKIDSTM